MMTPENTAAAPAADTQDANAKAAHDAQAAAALHNAGNTARASWPFSLDNVRANIQYMSPEAKELLVWAFTWCTDPAHAIRLDDFCERIGRDRNTIWKIYSGKYTHPDSTKENPRLMDASAPLLAAIRAFRKVELSREKLGRVNFVHTPTAKKVFYACDLARESQTPVFLYGASQVGKTEACRQYCIENNHGRSVLVELEAVNGLRGLLQCVAEKLGISPKANTPDLISRIKRAVTSDMVIVLDEVHLLSNVYRKGSFFACMETVRRLFVDHCKCGLVLTFTLLGYEKAEQERKRELEQIFRRGVHRVHLGDRPTFGDVVAVAREWGLEVPSAHTEIVAKVGRVEIREKPVAMLAQLAREQGMKAIIERLRYGSKLAANDGADLTWEHVIHGDALIKKNAAAPDHGWANT
jgi:DNA transposition AAA+ family ATPase